MAPVEDLEAALAADGKVDVQKKNGDWSKFTVGSLGKPFDVDGIKMCYGYAPGDDDPQHAQSSQSQRPAKPAPIDLREETESMPDLGSAPARDESEPLPDYQGGPDDEWTEF